MKTINGTQFIAGLGSGVNAMTNNIERIDALNVFPVPDGDTGSNMGATAISAFQEIKNLKDAPIHLVASKFSRGMLLGARGNSGVILSQIFKGFSVALDGKTEATAFDIVEAFKQASIYGYKSVMTPIEGTILTVIRLISENLEKTVTPANSIEEVFELATKFAREACDITPTLLAVLKEVGVTDSGGEGLFLIIEGIHLSLLGKPVEVQEQATTEESVFFGDGEVFDGEFGYCTEFIVDLKAPNHFKKDRFEQALVKMGANSIAVIQDEEILKVHIHTIVPGKVFTFAQKFGEFITLKSENMTLQANESQGKKAPEHEVSNERINIGVISCNIGNGIITEMRELGADFVIEGGQTMNPSASDFIEAIKKLNTDKIIILPNNSNIILAAQQVAQTITDKEIIIVPSKTQLQGLSALMNFNKDSTLDENKEEMNEAIGNVKTGQITKASRTTKIEGVSVRKDEFLAIADKKILMSTKSSVESAIAVSKKLINKDTEIVTIYYGDESTVTDAEELASFIETHYDVEVELKDGAQPVYNFLIGYE